MYPSSLSIQRINWLICAGIETTAFDFCSWRLQKNFMALSCQKNTRKFRDSGVEQPRKNPCCRVPGERPRQMCARAPASRGMPSTWETCWLNSISYWWMLYELAVFEKKITRTFQVWNCGVEPPRETSCWRDPAERPPHSCARAPANTGALSA